ncbi:hypothetical protein LTR47_003207 [Exophiala xenobiotica]|nr:hypothetical protein LTR72_006206 [Exophiala xenobiotica]KAK5235733.1 hypothetical protein LTR47_003207 [Exophiala xenobiotica]KAK5250479.1 hypothetical protein LTS06_004732 [Exophiala xenobiotica]KAK5294986.1 hypothetical protein LTR14_004155 [Exophiala xenobiotica]KAK5353964.1 hypothetical protein LTR61_002659 [Exophiala xenobiotica]
MTPAEENEMWSLFWIDSCLLSIMGSSHHSTPPHPLSDHVDLPSSSSTPSVVAAYAVPTPSFTPNSAANTLSSAPLRKSSAQRQGQASPGPVYSRLRLRGPGIWRRWILIISISILTFHLYRSLAPQDLLSTLPAEWRNDKTLSSILQPVTPESRSKRKKHDPMQWLKDHSSFDRQLPNSYTTRPRAALISLVRNEELDGILQSIRQLEYQWNRRYRYPWIFFNEKPFSDEFMAATSNATDARTEYHVVPREHWSTPTWIDQTRYMDALDYLGTIGVGKGHMLSYHSMIRWQSGFFYHHPALSSYTYYWRIEPDVHFFCPIPYDPFSFLAENDLVYGFNMAILDDARSFTSLWSVTRDFIAANSELVHPDADLDWLLDASNGGEYNNCQFFSNFEIGSLDFWRSAGPSAYFDHLDKNGGFFYERFGDAPVHTLALAMFARKGQVWFFRDVGYQHDIARHCPPASASVTLQGAGIGAGEQAQEEAGGGFGLGPRGANGQYHSEAGAGAVRAAEAAEAARRVRHETTGRPWWNKAWTKAGTQGAGAGARAGASAGAQSEVAGMGVGVGVCACEPTSLDENFYKLVPMESPQVKPGDTCIRLWLGGEWLSKKDGWKQDVERAFGGDGYGGYVLDGM